MEIDNKNSGLEGKNYRKFKCKFRTEFPRLKRRQRPPQADRWSVEWLASIK